MDTLSDIFAGKIPGLKTKEKLDISLPTSKIKSVKDIPSIVKLPTENANSKITQIERKVISATKNNFNASSFFKFPNTTVSSKGGLSKLNSNTIHEKIYGKMNFGKMSKWDDIRISSDRFSRNQTEEGTTTLPPTDSGEAEIVYPKASTVTVKEPATRSSLLVRTGQVLGILPTKEEVALKEERKLADIETRKVGRQELLKELEKKRTRDVAIKQQRKMIENLQAGRSVDYNLGIIGQTGNTISQAVGGALPGTIQGKASLIGGAASQPNYETEKVRALLGLGSSRMPIRQQPVQTVVPERNVAVVPKTVEQPVDTDGPVYSERSKKVVTYTRGPYRKRTQQ